ncbi:glucosaminidase domain-containing protein [Pseudanabaena sp. FACHB-1277]|jgi:N-acetylmuramoyl-L-alanine amidase|uniref:Glucosaminidase domain-containing protein n=1 Tax=Pseudanabaena cinerea FACHB-1277 TaxID=2949581 RepID=A0A926Z6Q5_9CYAN|nr:N-acetylmuramoyl-L-alanine amidase [Pseudanabaena cinerea]MBD2148969.1 glucosaminidase domain-containing protein [Pseudanabaena cinerea FACHB-1277]
MGKIFISAGHSGFEGVFRDLNDGAGAMMEVAELMATRDLLIAELRSRGIAIAAPSDDLNLQEAIDWINLRAGRQDIAILLNVDVVKVPELRGATAYYITHNALRKRQAEIITNALTKRVPEIANRGAKADTIACLGSLSFCRQVSIPSVVLELNFANSASERLLMQTRRRDYVIGIADGLQSWLHETATTIPVFSPMTQGNKIITYPETNINLNGQGYPERGILVSGNVFVPVDLVDRLGFDPSQIPLSCRMQYQGIVYVQAIALRELNTAVSWDSATRTLYLKTLFKVFAGQIDQIMGLGNASEVQLMMFLKNNNEVSLINYGELPLLYREEAEIEGVNHDVAFCQMCVETDFLRFGKGIDPAQNNFANLGTAIAIANVLGASFDNQRTGVRAHIQQLKAYACAAPLFQPVVAPRFNLIARGTAPYLNQLTGRWAIDPLYDRKIIALIRRLYESAGIF